MSIAIFHEELLVVAANGHAAIGRFVMKLFRIGSIGPELKKEK